MKNRAYPLRQDQRIVDQQVQPLLQHLFLLLKGRFRGVVEEIRRAHHAVFRVPDDGGLEHVEGEEIGDLVRGRVLDDVGPDDLLRGGGLVVEEPMGDFLLGELDRHGELLEVARQEACDGGDVLFLCGPEPDGGGGAGEEVAGHLTGFGRKGGQGGEADVVEFEPVERAVHVAAGGDGFGEDDAGRVDGLVDAEEVAAAGDFRDEDGGEAEAAQFLVHAEEVDFGGFENLGADAQGDGDAGDEGD